MMRSHKDSLNGRRNGPALSAGISRLQILRNEELREEDTINKNAESKSGMNEWPKRCVQTIQTP